MGLANEDLRHCVTALRALQHLFPFGRVARNIEFCESDTLLGQQPLGRMTKAAHRRGIDSDVLHRRGPFVGGTIGI